MFSGTMRESCWNDDGMRNIPLRTLHLYHMSYSLCFVRFCCLRAEGPKRSLGVGARASLSLAGCSWPGARVWLSHGGPFVGLGSRAACRSCYSFDYYYYFIVRSRRAFAWSIIFFYFNRVWPTATVLSSTPCRGGLGFSEFVLYFVGTAAHVHTGYWLSASVGHVCCTAVN